MNRFHPVRPDLKPGDSPVSKVPEYPEGAHNDFVEERVRTQWVRGLSDADFRAAFELVEERQRLDAFERDERDRIGF